MLLVSLYRGFVQKARRVQRGLLYYLWFHRMLRRRRYRIFLQLNTGHLPSFRTLEAWRKWLLYASFLSLTPSCLGVLWSWQWVVSDLLVLPLPVSGLCSPIVLCGMCCVVFGCFGLMVDYVIFKRDKSRRTVIHWI